VGGGISGLAAAFTLARARRAGAPVDEFLVEGTQRLGGVILTEKVDDFVLEGGPDSFLEQKPEAAALCRELGFGDSLIGSNDRDRRTYILHRGRLVPLPDGLVLLVPTRLWPMVTTPLLPLSSKLGVVREWFTAPQRNSKVDESVASFVRRHFGNAMLDNIADPLLAGVYGGDSGALSVRSVLPRFWEMEQKFGSLTRATLKAMSQRRRRVTNSGEPMIQSSPPLFMALKGGLEDMIGKLIQQLEDSRIRLGMRVTTVKPLTGGVADLYPRRYLVLCEGNAGYEADSVILAMPTHDCAQILSPLDPTLNDLLRAIQYSSSMTVSLGFGRGARDLLPQGFGFLVPHKENRRMLACTFVHVKFHHRAPEGKALLRCFLGGARDSGVLSLNDNQVLSIVRQELREVLGFSLEPLFYRIHRWPTSMAQYTVGHGELVNKIQSRLKIHPGIFLAGNAYSGIGISDCIRTGKAAAESALKHLVGEAQALTSQPS
jgi:oxygen-dependent protoporphyrinogen oxidase